MTWATDHIFVAGGDFVTEHWREFQAQAGVSAIITVSAEKPGEFIDPRPWALLWLPVEDEDAYTLEQLRLAVCRRNHYSAVLKQSMINWRPRYSQTGAGAADAPHKPKVYHRRL